MYRNMVSQQPILRAEIENKCLYKHYTITNTTCAADVWKKSQVFETAS